MAPMEDRDWYRGQHPPGCTCVECTDKRLGLRPKESSRREASQAQVSECPKCGRTSLFYNFRDKTYECLNQQCRVRGRSPEEIRRVMSAGKKPETSRPTMPQTGDPPATQTSNPPPPPSHPASGTIGGHRGGSFHHRSSSSDTLPDWLKAVLLVFGLSIVGLAAGTLVGGTYLFWVLFGFGAIFSIERWFGHITRKHRSVGKAYRLGLNLGILAILGLLIWTAVEVFSQHFGAGPLAGTIVVLAEFTFFVWLWRVLSKNSWRWPSMKLTVVCLAIVFVVAAFAGVKPLAGYKDKVVEKTGVWLQSLNTPAPSDINAASTPFAVAPTSLHGVQPLTSPAAVISRPTLASPPTPNLADPTWSQLVAFLRSDDTDTRPYVYPSFVCADFANQLQQRAKAAGWRCAVVTLAMVGYTDPYHFGIASDAGHDCNAFQTSDRGLVYIDDTGVPAGSPHPTNMDKTVNVAVGQQYVPQSMFPEPGWASSWDDMGTVTKMTTKW